MIEKNSVQVSSLLYTCYKGSSKNIVTSTILEKQLQIQNLVTVQNESVFQTEYVIFVTLHWQSLERLPTNREHPLAEFKGSWASCIFCQFDSVHYDLRERNNKHNTSMTIQCCDLFGSSRDAIFIFNHSYHASWKGQSSLHWLHFGHFLSWVLCQVKTLSHGYKKSGSAPVRKPSM